ncbi:uncharacterized protein BBA_00811 [Beauveria bassiana ARSEF 2860]|uniref:Uncharacterized protein n=1 Tax=Beauveria bassiana (strain ARSEF 2860) TaxID=655819 RepID=J4UV33_BEAB2|nr:uncharacterized protein BBA_00811 [Beauveria bassiana ARSEF 2860]EJP69942.1 hypothetical protein BBA_00811 [Beauveria bassiana ARSEF 2860]
MLMVAIPGNRKRNTVRSATNSRGQASNTRAAFSSVVCQLCFMLSAATGDDWYQYDPSGSQLTMARQFRAKASQTLQELRKEENRD